MKTATVTDEGECQSVHLPKGFHISTPTVGVRQEGDTIVLEPLRQSLACRFFRFDSHYGPGIFTTRSRTTAADQVIVAS
jgi:virulence-associated protein VagC